MKKAILSLALCLLAAASLKANQLTIINAMGCPLSFYFNMNNPVVHSQEVIIPPNSTTVYTDGSMVPTIWSSPTTPAQMALANFESLMFHPVDPAPGSTGYAFMSAAVPAYSSAPYAPFCNGGTYNATWYPSGTNIVLLIL